MGAQSVVGAQGPPVSRSWVQLPSKGQVASPQPLPGACCQKNFRSLPRSRSSCPVLGGRSPAGPTQAVSLGAAGRARTPPRHCWGWAGPWKETNCSPEVSGRKKKNTTAQIGPDSALTIGLGPGGTSGGSFSSSLSFYVQRTEKTPLRNECTVP